MLLDDAVVVVDHRAHIRALVHVVVREERPLEAVNDGVIKEMAEFQDGSAFVWRASELLATMNIDSTLADNISSNISAVEQAYETRTSPSEVSKLVDAVIADFEVISGVQSTESEHMEEAFVSPRHQVNSGVLPNEVECKPELILVLNNYDSRPACVTDSGADKLESLDEDDTVVGLKKIFFYISEGDQMTFAGKIEAGFQKYSRIADVNISLKQLRATAK